MNIINVGDPKTIILTSGQSISATTTGNLLVECVSGLGLTAGSTIATLHGSANYGPYATDGVIRLTASVRDGAYEVSQIPQRSASGNISSETVDLFDPATGRWLGVIDKAGNEQYILQPAYPIANGFSMIGDSRTADLTLSGGINSRNWFNWACAYYKQAPQLVGNYGVSGNRTDQYLTNGNFETALTDGSAFLIFGFPAVNDISQSGAGYTDTFGRAVTVSNVATYALGNLITYAKRASAAGKKVVMLTEPGAASLAANQVAAVHDFNRRLKQRIAEVPGAVLYDPCPRLWNTTSSTTLIAFRTNYSGDGTHNQQMAARVVGADFAANVLPSLLPKVDTAPANISDSVSNGTGQLFRNPLFSTLTGGTTGSNITVSSGTVPANCSVSGSASAGLTVTITSTANAGGYGNDVTFAFTSTGAVSGRVDMLVQTADWSLIDIVQGHVEMDVDSGGVNVTGINVDMYIQTDAGTKDWWAMYAGASGPASTAGDTGLVFRSPMASVLSGSTSKTDMKLRISVVFSAAGSQTITLRRAGVYRY